MWSRCRRSSNFSSVMGRLRDSDLRSQLDVASNAKSFVGSTVSALPVQAEPHQRGEGGFRPFAYRWRHPFSSHVGGRNNPGTSSLAGDRGIGASSINASCAYLDVPGAVSRTYSQQGSFLYGPSGPRGPPGDDAPPGFRAFDLVSKATPSKMIEERPQDDEKEEPDSDDEERDQPECVRVCRKWIHAVFPDSYPLLWFVIQASVCFVLLLVGLGDGSNSSRSDYALGKLDFHWMPGEDVTDDARPKPHIIGDIDNERLLLNGSFVFICVTLLNLGFWLCTMAVRVIVVTGLLNLICYERPAATAFASTVDPEIFYVAWSVFIYAFWRGHARSSHLVLVPNSQEKADIETLTFYRLFGDERFFTQDMLRAINLTNVVYLILSVRRAVLALMLFFFELGFLMNMNSQLVNYLTKYARIRKLNAKWSRSTPQEWHRPTQSAASVCSLEECEQRDLFSQGFEAQERTRRENVGEFMFQESQANFETKRQRSVLSNSCVLDKTMFSGEEGHPEENGRKPGKEKSPRVGGDSFSEEEGEVGRELAHEWEGGQDEMKDVTLSLRVSREEKRQGDALFVPPQDDEGENDETIWESRAGRAYEREKQVWSVREKLAGVWRAAFRFLGFHESMRRVGEGPLNLSARRRRNSSLHGLHLRPLFFPAKRRPDFLDTPNFGQPPQQRLEDLLADREGHEERERETGRDRGDGGAPAPGEGGRPPGRGSFFPGLRAHHQRPMSAFRIRHSLTKKRIDQEVSGQGLPRPLKAQSIEATKTSKVQNWLLIQYALHYPPALFIHGRRIALTNKEITGTIAELIFNQLVKENARPQTSRSASLLPELNHAPCPGESPPESKEYRQASPAPACNEPKEDTEKLGTENRGTDKLNTERLTTGRLKAEGQNIERPTREKQNTDKLNTERFTAEKPNTETLTTERINTGDLSAEKENICRISTERRESRDTEADRITGVKSGGISDTSEESCQSKSHRTIRGRYPAECREVRCDGNPRSETTTSCSLARPVHGERVPANDGSESSQAFEKKGHNLHRCICSSSPEREIEGSAGASRKHSGLRSARRTEETLKQFRGKHDDRHHATSRSRGTDTWHLSTDASRQGPWVASPETERSRNEATNEHQPRGFDELVPSRSRTRKTGGEAVAGTPCSGKFPSPRNSAETEQTLHRKPQREQEGHTGCSHALEENDFRAAEVEPSFADAPTLSALPLPTKRKIQACPYTGRDNETEGTTRGEERARGAGRRGGKGAEGREDEAAIRREQRRLDRGKQAVKTGRERKSSKSPSNGLRRAAERENEAEEPKEEDDGKEVVGIKGVKGKGGRSIETSTKKEHTRQSGDANEEDGVVAAFMDAFERRTGGRGQISREDEEGLEGIVVSRCCVSSFLALPQEPPHEAEASNCHSRAEACGVTSLSPFTARSAFEKNDVDEEERMRDEKEMDADSCRYTSRVAKNAVAPSPIVYPLAGWRHHRVAPISSCSEQTTGCRRHAKPGEHEELGTIEGQRKKRECCGSAFPSLDAETGVSRLRSDGPTCERNRNRRQKRFSAEAFHCHPPSPFHTSPSSAPLSAPYVQEREEGTSAPSRRLAPKSSLSYLSACSASPASSFSSHSPCSPTSVSPVNPTLTAEAGKSGEKETPLKTQTEQYSVSGSADLNSRPANPAQGRTFQVQSGAVESHASASDRNCTPLPMQLDSPAKHGYLLFPAEAQSERTLAHEYANPLDLTCAQKTGKDVPDSSSGVFTTQAPSAHAVSSCVCAPEKVRASFPPRNQPAPRKAHSNDELHSGGLEHSCGTSTAAVGGFLASVSTRELDTGVKGKVATESNSCAKAMLASNVTAENQGKEEKLRPVSERSASSRVSSNADNLLCVPRSTLDAESKKGGTSRNSGDVGLVEGVEGFAREERGDETLAAGGRRLATSSFSSSVSGSSPLPVTPSSSSRDPHLSATRVGHSRSFSSLTQYHSSFNASPSLSASSLSSSSALLLAAISSLPAASSVLTLAPPATSFLVSSSSFSTLPQTPAKTAMLPTNRPPPFPTQAPPHLSSPLSDFPCGPALTSPSASSPVSVSGVKSVRPVGSSYSPGDPPHVRAAPSATDNSPTGAAASVSTVLPGSVNSHPSSASRDREETPNAPSDLPLRKATDSRVVRFTTTSSSGSLDERESRTQSSAAFQPPSCSSSPPSASSSTLPKMTGSSRFSCFPSPTGPAFFSLSSSANGEARPEGSIGFLERAVPVGAGTRREGEWGEVLQGSQSSSGARSRSPSLNVKKTRSDNVPADAGNSAAEEGNIRNEKADSLVGDSTRKLGKFSEKTSKSGEDGREVKAVNGAAKLDVASGQTGGTTGWCASSSIARHSVESVDEPEKKEQEEAYLGRETIELYLRPEEAEEFMKQVDFAGHGKINAEMFKRAMLNIYNARKRLVRGLRSQGSVASTVLRMISLLLWFVCAVVMLLVIGVDMNTVIVSGAAFLSALTVALSYLYQHFITAVIFVALTNPYNVGDRIRVDGGEILTVRKIRTYTTEFDTVHGRPVIYSNSVLFSKVLTNESRAKNSVLELKLRVGIGTPHCLIKALETKMRKFVEQRPMDFVKDSFWVVVHHVQPGESIDYSLWMACVEGWGNYRKVLDLRSEVYFYLAKQVTKLGISFHLAPQPVSITNDPAHVLHMRPLIRNTSPSSPPRITYMRTAGPVRHASGHSMPPQPPTHRSARQVLDGRGSNGRDPSQCGLGGSTSQTQALSLPQKFQTSPVIPAEEGGGLGSMSGPSGASYSGQQNANGTNSGQRRRKSTGQHDGPGRTQRIKTETQTFG
uniref:Transporter, small conductance mechanosensitive ion channel (MscS) family protein n=1 Tax=Toxoplasma gondii COUG TaxID=1074873 RepID=A0A2G8XQ75_TOXGO|nr:transporter, small conductance mechanosensitive ion channel (MscS) family protein [Toxoplasma gondii COUG]